MHQPDLERSNGQRRRGTCIDLILYLVTRFGLGLGLGLEVMTIPLPVE